MVLAEKLGAAYRAIGKRFRNYPAHPSFIRSFDRSPLWALTKKPGKIQGMQHQIGFRGSGRILQVRGRPCAVFEYCGPAMGNDEARALLYA